MTTLDYQCFLSAPKADQVFQYFMDAVTEYGLPFCVRSDMGGENVRVAKYMFSQQHWLSQSRPAMIMGRSVHNQRIERLWLDVFQGSLSIYAPREDWNP